MNKELKRLSSLAKNNNLKLLPVMENLRKKDVYVVVDTPKKGKKFIKAVDIFNETLDDVTRKEIKKFKAGWLHNEYEIPVVVFENDKWIGAWLKTSTDASEEISIKQLKQLLAKEYLKVGDYFVDCNKYIFVLNKINEDSTINCSCLTHNTKGDLSYEDFKRYATPEEIALLEPKEIDKFAKLKEAHKNGAIIQFWCRFHQRFLDTPKNRPVWGEDELYRVKPEEEFNIPNAYIRASPSVQNQVYNLLFQSWQKQK